MMMKNSLPRGKKVGSEQRGYGRPRGESNFSASGEGEDDLSERSCGKVAVLKRI